MVQYIGDFMYVHEFCCSCVGIGMGWGGGGRGVGLVAALSGPKKNLIFRPPLRAGHPLPSVFISKHPFVMSF
jgi:hypothetical protein